MTQLRFTQTALIKMCDSQNTSELDQSYHDARDGWVTANGESRGGFDRLRLKQIYRFIINLVYNTMKKLLTKIERLEKSSKNNSGGSL